MDILELLNAFEEEIPLDRERVERILGVELARVESNNPYYSIYRQEFNLGAIEFRENNDDQKGLIILNPYQPVILARLTERFGRDFTVDVHDPQDPVQVSYSYRMESYRRSFALAGQNAEQVNTVVIDWTQH